MRASPTSRRRRFGSFSRQRRNIRVTAGGVDYSGDRDWFSVELTAGQTYVLGLQGLGSAAGSLADPYLRLYDKSGTLLAENDDGSSAASQAEPKVDLEDLAQLEIYRTPEVASYVGHPSSPPSPDRHSDRTGRVRQAL